MGLRYVYILRLIGPISYLGACYIRTKVTKCIREKMTLCFHGYPLNHIHQDTKSALAVCTRSFGHLGQVDVLGDIEQDLGVPVKKNRG